MTYRSANESTIIEATFATVDFETNLLAFHVPQAIIESHRWRAGTVQIDATEIMLPLVEGVVPEKDDGTVGLPRKDESLRALTLYLSANGFELKDDVDRDLLESFTEKQREFSERIAEMVWRNGFDRGQLSALP